MMWKPTARGGREEIFAVRRGPSPHRLAASAEGTNPAAEEEGGDRGRRVLVFWPLTLMAELIPNPASGVAVHQIYGFAERYTITA